MMWNRSATSEASCSSRVINSPVWRPVWKRIDRRCNDPNAVRFRDISRSWMKAALTPSPGDAEPHLGEAREQNQADGERYHAGEAALR